MTGSRPPKRPLLPLGRKSRGMLTLLLLLSSLMSANLPPCGAFLVAPSHGRAASSSSAAVRAFHRRCCDDRVSYSVDSCRRGALRSSASDVDASSASSSATPQPRQKAKAEKEKKSAAIEEAERLREKARLLFAEAAREEEALRSAVADRKASRDAEDDAAIEELLEVRRSSSAVENENGENAVKKFEAAMDEQVPRWVVEREAERKDREGRVRAVADRMRRDRTTTAKLLRVVDRVYERELAARSGRPPSAIADAGSGDENATTAPAVPPPGAGETFQIGAGTNVAEKNDAELRMLSGLIDEVIDAAGLLDEERRERREACRRRRDGGSAKAEGGKDGMVGANVASSSLVDEKDSRGGGEGEGEDEERHYGLTENAANVLRSRIKDLRRADNEAFKRRLASDLGTADRKLRGTGPEGSIVRGELRDGERIEDFVRRTMADSSANGTSVEIEVVGGTKGKEFNVSRFMMDVMQVPMWVPSSLLPFVVTCKDELDPDDTKRIKSEVLSGSRFYCTGWDSFKLAAVYRGNFLARRTARAIMAMAGGSTMSSGTNPSEKGGEREAEFVAARGDDNSTRPLSEEVFADVQSRLERAGLSGRVQLFLIDDPEWRPGDAEDTGGENAGPPPVLLAVPKSLRPEQDEDRGNGAKFLAGLSVVSTMVTTFAYGVSAYALNPDFFSAVVNDNDVSVLSATIPIFLSVLGLQAVHEAAHLVAAKARNVTLGLPVPLPSLQIGSFGSITPLRSFPETRTDLMDVALSGPGITMLLSLGLMIAGIGSTVGASAEVLSDLPVVPAALMKSSFLVGSVVSVLAPKVMSLQLSQPIPVHPLFMVGLTGLLSSALNLLPVGRLDGGRACSAAFGRRSAVLISFLFLLIMAIAALSGTSQISIFWGLLVTLFQRNGEIPTRDEVTGVDALRRGVYGALTAVALLALLPFPGGAGAL